jgi:crotonobetaine/carnitine-CoA ligase
MTKDLSTRVSLTEIIETRAAEHPEKVFIWVDDDPYTYAELRRRSRLAARGLNSLGIAHGDTVASFTRTCFDTIATLLGAAQAGAVFMPVNSSYKGEYLLHQLRDSATRAILIDEDLMPHLEAIIGELPDVRSVLVRSTASFEPRNLRHVTVHDAGLLQAGDAEQPLNVHPIAWNEPAFLFYTSGTTGPSKGALITQNYLSAMAQIYTRNFGLRPDDIQYSAVPLFHVSGAYNAVISVLISGHTSVLDSEFHVSTCWQRVRKFGATVFFGVGAMMMMLWNLPPNPTDADLPFRTLIAPPTPPELWKAMEDRYHCEVLQGYGQTEAIMIACQVAGSPNVPGSSGKPIVLYDVRIVDEDDDDVAAGLTGEIVYRPKGNHVMFEGYVGRPAETLAKLTNLWFHTGDFGRLDDEGNLYFVDRKSDVIRRRGENISSFEVEASILRHSDVIECAAYAVPSELGEDEVMISIVVAEDAAIDFGRLREHCILNMPRFAVPRYFKVVDGLPKSATGRLQKHVLRAAGVGPATWDAEAEAYVRSD